MKKIILLLVLLNTFVSISQTPLNDSHWKEAWGDDFNSFDDTKWRRTNFCDHGGEPQLYLKENVTTSNGNLVIRLTREDVICPANPQINAWECGSCQTGVKKYSSGMVISNVNNQVKYGYIEAKIKIPYGLGFWPAFWTWVGTPSYQEIDIFEMIPGATINCNSSSGFVHNVNHMTSNMHNGSNSPTFCSSKFIINPIDDYRKWHKYAIEWSPSKIIFYLDDIPFRVEKNDNKFDPTNII